MYFIPKYILCLFFLILVDFFTAKKIYTAQNTSRKKTYLILSIISNFGLLFYFKYLSFFGEVANLFLEPFSLTKFDISNTILPIGLSFHTFQSVSYVIDVYKNKIKPERHLGIYSTYVLFFPQMVAGPIERFSTLGYELKKNTKFEFTFIRKGIPLIIIGLFYKMVIADNCGEYVNTVYSTLPTQNSYSLLMAIFLFCIQIYSDFFGYSLIAQGSAKLFGIHLIDNFSFPLFSENILVFWRKWHISLTNWFRDYVYFPLGGSKKSKTRHYLNILFVFALSGLWHGAGFNFILWGALHAMAYLLTIIIFKKRELSTPVVLKWIFTFALVSVIFIFFRTGRLSESVDIIKGVFTHYTAQFHFQPVSEIILLNLFFLFLLEFNAKNQFNFQNYLSNNTSIKNMLLYAYLLFAIIVFSGIDNLPFIYFQF